jgi:hypothetical protein
LIPAFRRLRLEDIEFKASLGCIARHCLKKQKSKTKTIKTIGEKLHDTVFGNNFLDRIPKARQQEEK